jgi:hypothetical protein
MPTMKVEYNLEVQARAEKLWNILTDVKSWPEWIKTSYVKAEGSGLMKEGSNFEAELGGIKWSLTLIKAERPYRICWKGRRFGIEAIHNWDFFEEAGKTKVETWETMSGWVLLLIFPIIKRRLSKYDDKWISALKHRAEQI